ncbi:MAG: hypothetical protein ABSG67_09200 [Thermoguttaceae bacterium]
MEQELESIIQIVNGLASLYWHPTGFQSQEQIRSLTGNWREAFKWFLSSYAFERQGRSPHYSNFARCALDLYDKEFPGKDFETELWNNFLKCGKFPPDGKGANKKNNPLSPSNTKCSCVSQLISSLGDFGFNIVYWASSLVQSGDVKTPWNCLVTIRGIKNKIASLYLRDIVNAFEIDEDIIGNKERLQPIDVWTERGATALAGFLSMSPKSYWDFAEVIVKASERAKVRSTLTNTGLWILGAQLVGNAVDFHKLLLSVNSLRSFLYNQVSHYQNRIELIQMVLSKSGKAE